MKPVDPLDDLLNRAREGLVKTAANLPRDVADSLGPETKETILKSARLHVGNLIAERDARKKSERE